jgi:hypothetical protein
MSACVYQEYSWNTAHLKLNNTKFERIVVNSMGMQLKHIMK